MNQTSKLFLSLVLVSLLFCNFSWASDVCGDGAGYPDQYPFKNCGSVSTLTWDQANSCEELADNSSCTVAVAGGQGPYTWTISGAGFSFASGQTSIQTSEKTVTVFTQNACGAGSITVTDGCGSVVDNAVRSTDGHWQVIGVKGTARSYPGWATVEAMSFNCTYNGYRRTKTYFDQVKGRYALMWHERSRSMIPDPSKPRSVEYHTWWGYPGGTCTCEGDYGIVESLDGVVNKFQVPITMGSDYLANNNACGGNSLWAGYFLGTGIQIAEWQCSQ